MRRVKIVCTLGPASNTEERIGQLIEAGLDTARLNFSHGTHESHAEVAARVRSAARRLGRPVALLADLSGPKMRVGRFPDGPIELVEGKQFTLTTHDVPGDGQQVSQSYSQLPQDVNAGDKILLDDGLLRLRVLSTTDTDVVTEVEVGGPLSDKKGLNLPGVALSTPALTDKDRSDLEFAVEKLEVDYLALSFVRKADDVKQAQNLARGTPVIAKLEKPEAMDNLAEIIDTADGAMVARGDLGVETSAQSVPLLQKRIIREVNDRGKLVITATQMLDSMIRNPQPTRAEAADVANAVLDGTDALMLSGETASGRYPLEAVRMMDAIVCEVESSNLGLRDVANPEQMSDWGFANAAARAAALLSFSLPIKAIAVFTRDGRTANMLAEFRPRAPILALTPSERVATSLALEWGVMPRVAETPDSLNDALKMATQFLLTEKLCEHGDPCLLVVGWPPSAATNTVKLHTV